MKPLYILMFFLLIIVFCHATFAGFGDSDGKTSNTDTGGSDSDANGGTTGASSLPSQVSSAVNTGGTVPTTQVTTPTTTTINSQQVTINPGTVTVTNGAISSSSITIAGATIDNVDNLLVNPSSTVVVGTTSYPQGTVTEIIFDSADQITLPSGDVLNNVGPVKIVLNSAGQVIFADITSTADANRFTIEGYIAEINNGDTLTLESVPNSLFNLTLYSTEGNITDPFLKTECVILGKTSRYLYTGVSSENFGFYVPSAGSDFSLCMKTIPTQDFQRSCSSCGYVDFLIPGEELTGVFEYESPSLTVPGIYDDIIKSYAVNNFLSQGSTSRTDNLDVSKLGSLNSDTYSGDYRIHEDNQKTCIYAERMKRKLAVSDYNNHQASNGITITTDYLSKGNKANAYHLTSTKRAAKISELQSKYSWI